MVILFSGRKSSIESEIIKILTSYGANYISDKCITVGSAFTVISEYKRTDITAKKGIAVMLDNTDRFLHQNFPDGMTGLCEDTNETALKLFKESKIPVISCGMSNRNTVTVSSIDDTTALITVQRSLITYSGTTVEPAEYLISLKGRYSPISIMYATAILIYLGITPVTF